MRGRRPIPAAIRRLSGAGKRPVLSEPTPPDGTPACPTHLSDHAKIEWSRVIGELQEMGILSVADRAAIAAYCQCYARWVEAEEHLAAEGSVIKSPNGHLVQNAWLPIANKSLVLMHKFLSEFGLTPVARTRVHVKEKPDPNDEFAALAAEIEQKPLAGRPQ